MNFAKGERLMCMGCGPKTSAVRFLLASLAVLASCGLPHDADGTLNRVRGQVIRVGFAIDTPWTTDSAGGAGGIEGRLVRTLAQGIGAQIDWVHGQQGQLLEALRHRDLDLVVGGISGASPWSTQVGFTRPYYTDSVVIGGAPTAAAPRSIKNIQVAVMAGDPAASAIKSKDGKPVTVRDLASTNLPVAATTWRLAQLRRRPNASLLLLKQPHVLATPPGENAWLVHIERLLLSQQDSMPTRLRETR
jgi:polar amino acid transport system substrate-binding protein